MVGRMGDSGSAGSRAIRRERERRRREPVERAHDKPDRPMPAEGAIGARERRIAARTCAWCGGSITPGSRGPIPKWCSAACRHRAWEQTRAAASGRAAVQVVERQVEVRVPAVPTPRDWAKLFDELTRQLDDGRVYDRDLAELAEALGRVLDAYNRRPYVRDRNARGRQPFVR
jgi:hypothetical protein